ncbi:MAG TPA: hypothetical protein VF811_11180 [Parasulfuritortus sp.]
MAKRTREKQVIFRVDEQCFSDLEQIREQYGVNWSFVLRQFINEQIRGYKTKEKALISRKCFTNKIESKDSQI